LNYATWRQTTLLAFDRKKGLRTEGEDWSWGWRWHPWWLWRCCW